ncbi:hypothetical protein K0M31_016345 [Melipona bicolor]|uniref:Uncharacterized protein n=1 Tax=Melipona bicolor TaxID=60889 RepID=A0AA40KTD7_9HYME|nr:hypothetical protein K0M31_016345 [Melipona bicolor]
MKKLEITYEERNHELKRLVNGMKAYAYSKTVHTDIRPEVTDDESTQYTAKTTHETQARRNYQEPTERRETTYNEPTMKPSEALRTVKTLNGINHFQMEEFIESVRFARTRVSDTASLLRMILTKKITDRAKQSIRFCRITSYEELYATLRTQVSPIPSTVSGSRNKMQNIKQGIHETVQSYSNRFRQALNELEYAVKAKHSNPTARNLILKEENAEAVRFYICNLRIDLARCMIAMRPTSLIEAQQKASDMEISLQEITTRRLTYQPNHRPTTSIN